MENTQFIQPNKTDISSYANIDEIYQRHISLNVNVNYELEIIEGLVCITFVCNKSGTNRVILDNNRLEINSVNLKNGDQLKFEIQAEHNYRESLGTPLIIHLDKTLNNGDEINVEIHFKTSKNADAIQWVEKENTRSKVNKFMFIQCEPIHCRTFFPCQDTPAVKVSVEAKVTVPNNVKCVFSGLTLDSYPCESDKNLTEYKFEQKIPVPTYLIVLASGDIEYRAISERTGVWAEIGLGDRAKYEFEDSDVFIKAAEDYLDYKYTWGKYDILVLPKGFPFGGMENPCLTFMNPALLAGDKSLANVIAHEISHSWTGNGVTNLNWGNFWVNEGFTTFMERKLSELVNGEEMMKLEAQVGMQELKIDLDYLGEAQTDFTKLTIDFTGINPEDAFSTVPYEKGFAFLYHLETLVGKENFRTMMRKYIKLYFGKSVTHEAFKGVFEDVVKEKFSNEESEKIFKEVDWNAWLFTPGKPLKTYDFNNKYFQEAKTACELVSKGTLPENFVSTFKNWHTNVKVLFLSLIQVEVEEGVFCEEGYRILKEELNLNYGYNCEVCLMWFTICLKLKKTESFEPISNYLGSVGRMKYLKPLYKGLKLLDVKKSQEIYATHKTGYHPIAVRALNELLS